MNRNPEDAAESSPTDENVPADRGPDNSRFSAFDAARRAADQLGVVRNRPVDGVVGIDRTEDGWQAIVELVEMERIPPSTDVLGAYEVTLDRHGDLLTYARRGRYQRGRTGEDDT